jgi:hypothetical protein
MAPRQSNTTPIVMVSSTVRDFPEHRQAVLDACLRQRMLPKMMEHAPAVDEDAIEMSLKLVDEADIYLGIFGYRYGFIPKGRRKSVTQLEYERAVKRGIPRLIFVMHEDHPVRASDVETGARADRIKNFKNKLMAENFVNLFKSSEELRTMVVNSLAAAGDRLKSRDRGALSAE